MGWDGPEAARQEIRSGVAAYDEREAKKSAGLTGRLGLRPALSALNGRRSLSSSM